MNKIIVDKKEFELDIQDDSFLYVVSDSIINIKVKNNKFNKLLLFAKNKKININIKMFDNSHLELNNLGIDSSINYDVDLQNNCYLLVVDSIMSKLNSINNIDIKSLGQNNNSIIYTNGINLQKNKLYFKINGIIRKESTNSTLNENSKVINLGLGDSKIIPNLIIDTNDVIANHSAFIGTFNKEELYYLMSRGIKRKNAQDLLIKSILLKGMKINNKLFIKEISKYLEIGGDFFE